MTRVLACSDIHNNINAVCQLRAREVHDYDAVIMAGDIGSDRPDEVFDILRTFDCPVLLGNWDHRLEHRRNFGAQCHHLHLTPYPVGDLSIIGGIDQEWEASSAEAADDAAIARQAHLARQRAKLAAIVAAQAPERTIVVSHYRLTKTHRHAARFGGDASAVASHMSPTSAQDHAHRASNMALRALGSFPSTMSSPGKGSFAPAPVSPTKR
ncbi:metallophosphoesterase family protein [Rhizobium ruizarguesonis]